MIQQAIGELVVGNSLSAEDAAEVMSEIMNGETTPAQFGAFVTALRLKGETPEEIAGMAQVMREKALRVKVDGPLLDTCGTGGDASGSFNISTTAAFVVAGAGARVAKHGNRAMSGACGSADVLEELGVKIDLTPLAVQQCLNDVGFGFMFAQTYHPAMRFAAGPRREIGIRTVFNILGPLTNPARATSHLLGVADASVGEKMARVLGELGGSHALVVHGLDGLDEITLGEETQIWELKNGLISTYTTSPEACGFKRAPLENLSASTVMASAQMLREVLGGKLGPTRDIVLMNAAAALIAADKVMDLKEGVLMATESIDSGEANRKLELLTELTQKLSHVN